MSLPALGGAASSLVKQGALHAVHAWCVVGPSCMQYAVPPLHHTLDILCR